MVNMMVVSASMVNHHFSQYNYCYTYSSQLYVSCCNNWKLQIWRLYVLYSKSHII